MIDSREMKLHEGKEEKTLGTVATQLLNFLDLSILLISAGILYLVNGIVSPVILVSF